MYNIKLTMEYSQKFFYEYVNILVDLGCPKYDAIYRYIWDPTIPKEYKTIKCIQEELQHAIQILNDEKSIRDANKLEVERENEEYKNEIIY